MTFLLLYEDRSDYVLPCVIVEYGGTHSSWNYQYVWVRQALLVVFESLKFTLGGTIPINLGIICQHCGYRSGGPAQQDTNHIYGLNASTNDITHVFPVRNGDFPIAIS